jgi:hypothetical protein
MPYVTLQQAKTHLRVEDAQQNDDIYLKVQQASAIITDYLKIRPIAIASVSVANPTVITTSVPHSLVTGTTYTIGGTTTTPTVNGAFVVTVTGATTFTVPVNVTIGQATAAGTVGTPVWTELTVPFHIQSATLLMLSHLYEHRGDDMGGKVGGGNPDTTLWQAIDRILMRSRDPALA